MPTEKEVYEGHADQYERLILREDHENNIPAAINQIKHIADADIIELGAGTGRVTRLLSTSARSVRASDLSLHMLTTARDVLVQQNVSNTIICVADMRRTPYEENCADLIIAGWSFCYLAVWGEEEWKDELEAGLDEAQRLLRPGGVMMMLENYGTGFVSPAPPPHLDPYFAFLKKKGFEETWFRTDYAFHSLEEALALSGFFFGDEMAEKVKKNRWTILPECTGLLWRKY
jgi:ubiquinone/menaquinone biosynthesis C-methylase UbiE